MIRRNRQKQTTMRWRRLKRLLCFYDVGESMNGRVCVPNMGASISGLGLKLPPDLLPFLTTASSSKLAHSTNWNPLQAIAGHDSPESKYCLLVALLIRGAGIPMRSSAQHWPIPTWSRGTQNLAWGTLWTQFSYLGPTFRPCKLPITPNKGEKSWDFTYFLKRNKKVLLVKKKQAQKIPIDSNVERLIPCWQQ